MNKYFLLLFIFVLQIAPAKAQWVTIPDTNFVNKLTQLYPSCMNGNLMDINCSQIVNATSLNISSSSISDLTGIEYFVNLTSLNCSNNYYLTNLPSLPGSLEYLFCTQNQLSSLSPLPSTLITLECWGNQLSTLPLLPSSLSNLSCWSNQLSSLPVLPNSMTNLNCSNNQLTSLPVLPNLLQWLDCNGNQLTSLPVIPNSVTYLSCGNNLLTSLPALPATLWNLLCHDNPLYTLPNLPGSLSELRCGNNQLTSLPVLPNSLNFLSCRDNQLTNLPALPGTLETLWCYNNQLTSLPPLPNVMQWFNISNNNILCLMELPQVTDTSSIYTSIANNLFTCVPNQTNYSLGLPLCMDNDPVNNPNYCTGVANITGFVFKDLDTNCNYSNTDWHTENIPVKVYDSQNNLLSMSYTVNGAYSFTLLQPDTFVVKIDDTILPFSMDCSQPDNQSVALDSANQTIQNINFPVVCDTAYDINVNSVNSQGWVFPGQLHTVSANITDNVSWYNLNCSSINYSGTVSLYITGPVTYLTPVNNALTPTVNGNTFTYNISDFSSLTPASFGLQFLTDTTAQANDQICVHLEINPTPIDADATNNVYDFCYQVANSYDPNMKEVYPLNVLPGYDDWFTYTIHFQNTGNAPAFNIRLRDTLDMNLDLNTFEITGYSHPAIVSINGNILTVRFNNIMLPDSTTDYDGSRGYFQYRIKPLSNLPPGTQIENTAYIYFDYNAPIVTNTTQNNFDFPVKAIAMSPEETQFVIFPNPSTGIFIFKDSKNIKTIEVFNIMGELVLSQGNAKQINLQPFSKGVYLVRINGVSVSRLLME